MSDLVCVCGCMTPRTPHRKCFVCREYKPIYEFPNDGHPKVPHSFKWNVCKAESPNYYFAQLRDEIDFAWRAPFYIQRAQERYKKRKDADVGSVETIETV